MIKKSLFVVSALTLVLAGCDNQQQASAPVESQTAPVTIDVNDDEAVMDEAFKSEHTAYNSLDWQGTYQGVLPCADCAGIEYTLVLNDDLTYQLTQVYQGKEQADPFVSQGKFHWENNGSVITLDGESDAPNQYFVGENMLMKLDSNGERITGDLASLYNLKKQ